MKKLVLLLIAGLMLGGGVVADEENGALGLGVMAESSNNGVISGNVNSLRGTLFLNAGSQLYGPLYCGFEFQGDIKKINQTSADFSQTDISIFGFSSNDYSVYFVGTSTNNITITNTLWDLDFSPRGYLSFDVGKKIQLLGFGGVNFNWQTAEYELKVTRGHYTRNGVTYGPGYSAGDTYRNSTSLPNDHPWSFVAGGRVTLGVFYVDYTRFLQSNSAGDYSFNQYNKDRFSLGLNLRF